MTLKLQLINDNAVTVGELKKFLSTIPDNFEIITHGDYADKLLINTHKDSGTCEIKLENQNNEIQKD